MNNPQNQEKKLEERAYFKYYRKAQRAQHNIKTLTKDKKETEMESEALLKNQKEILEEKVGYF